MNCHESFFSSNWNCKTKCLQGLKAVIFNMFKIIKQDHRFICILSISNHDRAMFLFSKNMVYVAIQYTFGFLMYFALGIQLSMHVD